MWKKLLIDAGLQKAQARAYTQSRRGQKQSAPIKKAVAITIGAAAGIIAFKILKKDLQAFINKRRNEKIWDKEKDENKKLTYKPSQYLTWADSLQGAFDPGWLDGTDEETIYRIFKKLKNNNDWLELQKAYGTRDYSSNFTGFPSKKITLVKALNQELDGDEKKYVNLIFANRNITYRL